MIEILIDTNALISFFDSSDKWCQKTMEILKELKKFTIKIIVTDITLNETVNVLCKRFENKNKSNEIPALLAKIQDDYPVEKITWVSPEICTYHLEILKLISKSNGLLNYNDSLLLTYMLKKKIKYVISYDDDFDLVKKIYRIKDANFQINELQ